MFPVGSNPFQQVGFDPTQQVQSSPFSSPPAGEQTLSPEQQAAMFGLSGPNGDALVSLSPQAQQGAGHHHHGHHGHHGHHHGAPPAADAATSGVNPADQSQTLQSLIQQLGTTGA